MTDKNSLAFWYPKISDHGLPVPRTKIVPVPPECDLSLLLDGSTPNLYDQFIMPLREAISEIGTPCFLRTSHGSGKHDWSRTCYVTDVARIELHVWNLVEWSHLVDLGGLPYDTWAVREMIETDPLFHAFWGMPITREFRVFATEQAVETVLPYWPPAAIRRPDTDDWEARLHEASTITHAEQTLLEGLAKAAVAAVGGGYWSIDFLEDREGFWFLTDMADGERSHRSDRDDV